MAPISTGDKLPDATLMKLGEGGPEEVDLQGLIGNGKAVIFGLPGAFTGTCSSAHLPSFMRTRDGLADKGAEQVICVSVNDPFVMQAWDQATGAGDAGVTLLADPSGDFVKALGLDFTAPPAGLYGRSQRFSMLIEDGEVKIVNVEDNPGQCTVSAGEALLDAM